MFHVKHLPKCYLVAFEMKNGKYWFLNPGAGNPEPACIFHQFSIVSADPDMSKALRSG
jgi:hypothetical protein